MISSYRHKGLEAFALKGDKRGIVAAHAGRLKRLLTTLDTARSVADIAGRDLHPLSDARPETKDRWAMSVSGAWRLIFNFEDPSKAKGDIQNVDYCNYH